MTAPIKAWNIIWFKIGKTNFFDFLLFLTITKILEKVS